MNPAVVERFWTRVDKNGPIPEGKPELGNCWVWTGGLATRGYGQVWTGRRRMHAHRFSLELAIGTDLGPGLFACHHCDNPPCVRPSHLFVGTNSENTADMFRKGRNSWHFAPQATCRSGHPFTGTNVLVYADGVRRCRTCQAEHRPAKAGVRP